MTHSRSRIALEKHFRLYQELLLEGAPYGAAVALAEIFHGSARLPAEQRAAWQSRIKEELTEQLVQEVRIGLEQDIQRIRLVSGERVDRRGNFAPHANADQHRVVLRFPGERCCCGIAGAPETD